MITTIRFEIQHTSVICVVLTTAFDSQTHFSPEQNEETKAELLRLRNNGPPFDELRDRLMTRLTFGTAGIRGVMRAGFNGMNELVIIQTSQGLARYLSTYYGERAKTAGVVIGYDARHNSRKFAERAAVCMLQEDIPVRLFSQIVPTPFVPFAVRNLSAVAGIVVTASHNPKQDNGYKVYFDNGAQIISPHDKNIQALIEGNLEPWKNSFLPLESWSADYQSKLSDPLQHISTQYFKQIQKSVFLDTDIISRTTLHFTYTSLHGVGHQSLTRGLETCSFPNFTAVPEQMKPDPEFPTVEFPNPEEGKGVLDLSFKTADSVGSTIILANDPDADRCAVAEKQPNGSWKVFTGNELGALLGWWMWRCFRENEKTRVLKPSRCYMMASAVSSSILNSMAKKEGFNFIETLTGFKWMGNRGVELTQKKKFVIFAFEEAIGFMCDPRHLPDKDGISASIQVASLAVFLREQYKRSLTDQISFIFNEYGYHTSLNSYFICHDRNTIDTIFREMSDPYPEMIGSYKVIRVRDLNRGFDSGKEGNLPDLPISKSSYMLTFYFDNGVQLTIRTSGTEPKIKYYSEIVGAPGDSDWKKLDNLLADVVSAVIRQCIQPERHKLGVKKG